MEERRTSHLKPPHVAMALQRVHKGYTIAQVALKFEKRNSLLYQDDAHVLMISIVNF